MRFGLPTLVLVAVFAGCGGGGGGGGAPASLPGSGAGTGQTAPQSPGGIWAAASLPPEALTLFISEHGDLRAFAEGPSLGAGAVIVTNGNAVSGAYQTRSLQSSPSGPAAGDRDCTLQGTVTEHVSMQLTIRCIDGTGAQTERSLAFFFDAAYRTPTSLQEIAGNYTIEARPSTNTLNINGDGTLFGMLDNGLECLMNGNVEIIDAEFGFYRMTVTLSSCTRLAKFEGATLTGFATRVHAVPSNGFLAFVSGVVDGRLEAQSLLFVPT